MTVATSFTNTLPSIVDSPAPAGAAPGSSGAGRASDVPRSSGTHGFASAFESALTDREASTARPEQTRHTVSSSPRIGSDRHSFSAPPRLTLHEVPDNGSRPGSNSATAKATTAKAAQKPDFAAKDSAAARPGNATKSASATKADAADKPNNAKANADRGPVRSDGPKADPVQSGAGKPDNGKPDTGQPDAGKAAPVATAGGTEINDDASSPAEMSSAPDAQDELTNQAAGNPAPGQGLLVAAVETVALPEAPAPDVAWGDLEGTKLAGDQPLQLSGTDEEPVEADAPAPVTQTVPAGSFQALMAKHTAAPATPAAAPGDDLNPSSAKEAEKDDSAQSTSKTSRPETAAEAAGAGAADANGSAAASATPAAVAVTTVAVAAISNDPAPQNDKQPARDSAGRTGSSRAEGKPLPQMAEPLPTTSRDPIAFTMQLQATGTGSHETAGNVTAQSAATAQAAGQAGPGALSTGQPGQATPLADNNATNPQTSAEPVKAVAAPVIATTARGEREPHHEGRGQDGPPSQEQPSTAAFPAPAMEKHTGASATSLAGPQRLEATSRLESASASRVVTAAEAVADASSTRVDQVQNLPRPIGPQRLALRVDPPPVAGVSSVQAPGRAVDLYLEQRGADVHFAVHSADPSMVSDLRGSVKELSSRLEQAGFRTESFLPSDAVRGLGQAASANGSAFRDDEPAQRQPGENPSGQGGQQSGQRESRENREGQQPQWLSEFEEMFGRSATGSMAPGLSPRP